MAQPVGGHSGTTGPPMESLEFRLEGSEELGYNPLGEPPRGEILMRGPAMFKEYYKDPEKTSESVGKLPSISQRLNFSPAIMFP